MTTINKHKMTYNTRYRNTTKRGNFEQVGVHKIKKALKLDVTVATLQDNTGTDTDGLQDRTCEHVQR